MVKREAVSGLLQTFLFVEFLVKALVDMFKTCLHTQQRVILNHTYYQDPSRGV